MHLQEISLVNFKNYADGHFTFSPGVNCLVGDNGSGKTTVLDAIHYLGSCKSYFNPIDSQNIRHQEDFFVVEGHFQGTTDTDKVVCGVKRGQKKSFRRNGKEYERLADHIGRYPVVVITPNDADLIRDGSEVRRKLIDSIISQYNRRYLDDVIQYNKALSQRNNLLKHFFAERRFDEASLEIWDIQLVDRGTRIAADRIEFMGRFGRLFAEFYTAISGGRETCSVELQTDLAENSMQELLLNARSKDRQLQRTTRGIHKDDLALLIDGHPVKKYGSQGQQKSLLIALKLAQFAFVHEACGKKPLLLLDDIFDKIDDKRVGYLMELVTAGRFGQIFITDTHARRVPELFDAAQTDLKVFEINPKISSS